MISSGLGFLRLKVTLNKMSTVGRRISSYFLRRWNMCSILWSVVFNIHFLDLAFTGICFKEHFPPQWLYQPLLLMTFVYLLDICFFLIQAVCMNFNRIMGVYIRQSVQGQSCWSLEKALFRSCLYFSRLGLNQTYHQNTLTSTQALHMF